MRFDKICRIKSIFIRIFMIYFFMLNVFEVVDVVQFFYMSGQTSHRLSFGKTKIDVLHFATERAPVRYGHFLPRSKWGFRSPSISLIRVNLVDFEEKKKPILKILSK